jgi:hypothetical protein
METLLSVLSGRFSNAEENLATEALHFLIVNSSAAREALLALISRIIGHDLQIASFILQASSSDGTIPDMVALDSKGKEVILFESKFWAGLTDSQPTEYVKRLRENDGELLLFICPERRLVSLWAELVRRCNDANLTYRNAATTKIAGVVRMILGNAINLALISWNGLLNEILQYAIAAKETLTTENIHQLQGLCTKMEESGFLPFRSEELGVNFAVRLRQLCGIIDDLVQDLVSRRMASIKGNRSVGGAGYYGQYMLFKGNGAGLWLDANLWLTIRETPLWLELKGPDWKPSKEIELSLSSILLSSEPEAFLQNDGAIIVPLFILAGVERDAVVSGLFAQVKRIYDLIPTGQGNANSPSEQS